jgi:exodeoxyribonuclease V alpha subunit
MGKVLHSITAIRGASSGRQDTGVTRGKKLVVLVGQRKAVAIAVRNVSGRRRWSKLCEWLHPGMPRSRQIDVAG